MARTLHAIAEDIREHWEKPYFGAVPYLEAMKYLNTVDNTYGADDGNTIVNYFLSNAKTWRGEDARRIKTELRGMVRSR
jgi:hypothetical protein